MNVNICDDATKFADSCLLHRMRPAVGDDFAFLVELFYAVRGPDFEQLDQVVARQMLDMQFQAQVSSYRTTYPGAVHTIFELLDGTPIGRMIHDEGPSVLHIIDIAVLPVYRCQGVGTSAVVALQQVAARRKSGVTLNVARDNPARSLYQRLGFTENGDDEVYDFMQWSETQRTTDGDYAL